jgi:hypothetical protein
MRQVRRRLASHEDARVCLSKQPMREGKTHLKHTIGIQRVSSQLTTI